MPSAVTTASCRASCSSETSATRFSGVAYDRSVRTATGSKPDWPVQLRPWQVLRFGPCRANLSADHHHQSPEDECAMNASTTLTHPPTPSQSTRTPPLPPPLLPNPP